MTTVSDQIQSADEAICRNIESLADQRALLSQNLLSQLRNLVEGVAVRLHTGSPDAEFNYAAVEPGLAFVKSRARFNFLGKFHKLIQISASHYTLDSDASERLMLKYYEYLHRIRSPTDAADREEPALKASVADARQCLFVRERTHTPPPEKLFSLAVRALLVRGKGLARL